MELFAKKKILKEHFSSSYSPVGFTDERGAGFFTGVPEAGFAEVAFRVTLAASFVPVPVAGCSRGEFFGDVTGDVGVGAVGSLLELVLRGEPKEEPPLGDPSSASSSGSGESELRGGDFMAPSFISFPPSFMNCPS